MRGVEKGGQGVPHWQEAPALQRSKQEMTAIPKGQTPTQWASTHLVACASKDIAKASTTALEGMTFERF